MNMSKYIAGQLALLGSTILRAADGEAGAAVELERPADQTNSTDVAGSSVANETATEAADATPLADVAGPINEAAGASIVKNVNFKITFRKDKLGNKQEGFTLTAPVPTQDGLIAALSDEKQTEYLLDLVEAAVYSAVRDQVGDETKPVRKQEDLDVSKLTLQALANVPKAVRTGGGISKEVWEEFSKDYIATMPAVTGKNIEQVTNAATIFVRKLQPVKTNMPALKFLREQLALYFQSTDNKEDFQQCVEFLDNKIEEFLNKDEASLIGNL
jgi:hypothetical protein